MKTGIQLYSFKPEIDSGEFDRALNLAARCGVEGVELFSFYDIPAIRYRKTLNEAGVVCYGSHNHLQPLLNDLDHVMEYNYILGNQLVLCDYLYPEEHGTRDKWLFVAESFNKIAEKLKHNGFDFAYHNHAFEFEEVFDGECGMDILLNNTDPFLVGIELHINQLPKYGIDQAAYIKKLSRRLKVLHVHTFMMDGTQFDSTVAINAAKQLDVQWAVIENIFSAPADIEAVKRCVGTIRDLTRGL